LRNQWYGDHRDLVKWGTLLELARSEQLRFILQVAYLRPDEGVPVIASERGDATVAKEVLQHFRDIRQIAGLGALVGLKLKYLIDPSKRNLDKSTLRRSWHEFNHQIAMAG
jgi:hypothetical protein